MRYLQPVLGKYPAERRSQHRLARMRRCPLHHDDLGETAATHVLAPPATTRKQECGRLPLWRDTLQSGNCTPHPHYRIDYGGRLRQYAVQRHRQQEDQSIQSKNAPTLRAQSGRCRRVTNRVHGSAYSTMRPLGRQPAHAVGSSPVSRLHTLGRPSEMRNESGSPVRSQRYPTVAHDPRRGDGDPSRTDNAESSFQVLA